MLFEVLFGIAALIVGIDSIIHRQVTIGFGRSLAVTTKVHGRSAVFIGFGLMFGGLMFIVAYLYQANAADNSDEIGFYIRLLALFCIGLGFGAAVLKGILSAAFTLGESIGKMKHNPHSRHPLEDQPDE